MSWTRAARDAALALTVALAALLLLDFNGSAALRSLETASLDLRFRLRGPEKPGGEIAIVLVDENTVAALGRWPLSRTLFAKAVAALARADARLIVFDLLFAEPDQPIPLALRQSARAAADGLPPGYDAQLQSALEGLAGNDPDAEFAAAIRASGRVLLPVAFDFDGPARPPPPVLAASVYQQLDDSRVDPEFPLQPQAALMPLAPLAAASGGLGHVSIAYDVDGAPRYDYLALPYDGDFVPSLAVRAAAGYLGIAWDKVGLALGDGVRIGALRIPTDPAMKLVVNYRGPRGTFPTFSFADLVDGKVPASALAGRIVLVGASIIGIADTNPAPFGNTPLPGTERMANVIDSILARDLIGDAPPPWPAVVIALVAGLAAITGFAASLLPTRLAALAGAAPVVLWCAGTQIAFDRGLWLPLVNPALALALTTVSVLLYRYGFVDFQRRRIQIAFRHYLAPEMVAALADHPERLQLGGETRTITVMFSDIRGFTSISETFKSNPQGLSRLINQGFLTPMTALIMQSRGTIDKYIGDCIMAFWNAPLDVADHADHACGCALAMVAALEGINRGLGAEAASEGREFHPIHIGVGLNTGDCVVGNMGSNERFAYTAMGDAVNLASRLEGQSKTYHVPIILGETTRAQAPDWAALELDLIAVIGKREPVRVFALLGDKARAAAPEFREHAARHDRMLARYRARNWTGARRALAECRAGDPALGPFYDLYAQRIDQYAANPPGEDWTGVFVAETK